MAQGAERVALLRHLDLPPVFAQERSNSTACQFIRGYNHTTSEATSERDAPFYTRKTSHFIASEQF